MRSNFEAESVTIQWTIEEWKSLQSELSQLIFETHPKIRTKTKNPFNKEDLKNEKPVLNNLIKLLDPDKIILF